MGYTPRTLVRHVAIYLVLAALPLPLVGRDAFLFWIGEHLLFLVVWTLTMIALGISSHYLVVQGIPGRLVERIRAYLHHAEEKSGEETGARGREKDRYDLRPQKRSIATRIASCSRCLAYWSSGAMAFLFAISYFHGWIAGIYFFAAGASLGSASAVAIYLVTRDHDGDRRDAA